MRELGKNYISFRGMIDVRVKMRIMSKLCLGCGQVVFLKVESVKHTGHTEHAQDIAAAEAKK